MSKQEIIAVLKDGRRVSHWVASTVLVGMLLLMGTGAMAQSGSIYGERGAQQASPVTRAIVLQTRAVEVQADATTRYAGGGAGAALGAALGAKLGKNSNSTATALGLVGAAIGGLGGAKLADKLGSTRTIEYIVQTYRSDGSQGEVLAIAQPDPGQSIGAGEPVYLINTSGTWRVVVRLQSASAPAAAPQAPTGYGGQRPSLLQGIDMVESMTAGRF